MKHLSIRLTSVLLIVILLLGMAPAVSAGGDLYPVDRAILYLEAPMGGGHPTATAAPVGTAWYTVGEIHFFNCYDGNPVGGYLPSDFTFEAGRLYACQVHLIPQDGYGFVLETDVRINGRVPASATFEDDGDAWFTVFFTAAPGTVTVTFDSNGHGQAPAPLVVPRGGYLADGVADVSRLTMHNLSGWRFIAWSRNCFAVGENEAVSVTEPITEDTTLYAVWGFCPSQVELYVSLPENCLEEDDVSIPSVEVPSRAKYSAEADRLYVPNEEGGPPDFDYPNYLDYSWPYALKQGETYYGRIFVEVNLGDTLPIVWVEGGDLFSLRRLNDGLLEVVYTITVPQAGYLSQADLFIETPRAGQSAMSARPMITCLTPGLSMSVQGWYTDSALSEDWYEGTLEAGKTYYALVGIGSGLNAQGEENYNLAYNMLQMNVFGLNAQLVRMVDLATEYGIPNYAGAVVAVTIPKTYEFVVEVPYGGGKFRSDRHGDNWVTIMDFAGVEEGPITLEALADPEHLFSEWYDAKTWETLSRDAEYTFDLDRDVHIKASFVTRPPFVDVGAHDYFYEPVMWAIEHEPVITSGVDDTHFGPKQECTRAQIVTFLWKALNEPEYDPITNPFSDVKAGKYYYDAVLWAYSNGITSGVGGGKFGVSQGCTRAQAMFFLWKSYGAPLPESTYCPFTDVSPQKYYYNAILWAYENGVTGGLNPTTFGVDKTCTRAQIITFLHKVYGPKG